VRHVAIETGERGADMGVMRFLIHPAARLRDWPEVHRAYVCGTDQTVFPTRVELNGNVMACRRPNSESGKLHVAWDVPGFGRPVLSTASLPERDEPYLLPVELARGKLVQLRNQAATWQGAGMQMPQGFADLNSEAHRLFARCAAVQEHPDQACQLAEDVIRRACEAAELLTRAYSRQSLANRQRRYQQIPTLLGCNLSQELLDPAAQRLFVDTFNAAGVPIEWRLIEPVEGEYHWEASDALVDWCTEHRLVARGGPLLDFSPDGLPPWLWKWENDVSNLQSFVCDFVETAMRKYLGKIRLWEVSARVNSGGALTLSEEARLSLVAKTLEVARHVDEESQLFIRVDQPWAEYQARGQHRLSPLHFADALLRAGLGLSGVNLEIAVGYRPRGSSSRDLLDYSRLIDVWSVLGLPLHVTLAFPSGKGPDPQCTSELEVDSQSWKAGWSADAQRDWIELHLPLFLAKPAVVGVFWTHFSDAQPHTFPHAGLLDASGHPKPALDRIAHQRKAWLK
jgi:GH35 family endo-1,4-beta-xylanase